MTLAWVWAGGGVPVLVPLADARISVLDAGLSVGDGVFETCKVIDSRAFALTRHLGRLAAGARVLEIPVPDLDVVRDGVAAVLGSGREPLPLGRLRITLTAGIRALGTATGTETPSVIITCHATEPLPAQTSAVLVPWARHERSPLVGIKSTSYAENVLALRFARRAGANEALMANTAGELCEGATSNVFGVVDGRLVTPALETGCLPGITRALVLEWFEADEVRWPTQEFLATVDAVFVTSSMRDIHPLESLDARRWSGVDPTTAHVVREFAARARADIDP